MLLGSVSAVTTSLFRYNFFAPEIGFAVGFANAILHQAVISVMYTPVRALQEPNAELPILVTLLGMVILVKLVQLENAAEPIDVTLSGIMILVKLVQPENALPPILVTPFGIMMLVNLEQPSNAELEILVTGTPWYVEGIMMSVSVQVPIPLTEYSPLFKS